MVWNWMMAFEVCVCGPGNSRVLALNAGMRSSDTVDWNTGLL